MAKRIMQLLLGMVSICCGGLVPTQSKAGGPPIKQALVAPADPTSSDCLLLDQQFLALLSQNDRQWQSCWGKSPIKWEYCSAIRHPSVGRNALTPQPQCCPLMEEWQSITEQRESEMAVCRERAEARRHREGIQKDADERELALAKKIKSANDWNERISNARELLDNPYEFLRSFRDANGPSDLVDRIFVNGGKIRDPKLGEELYKYLFSVVNKGAEANPNKLAGKIQQDALKELSRYHAQLFQDFQLALDSMDDIVGPPTHRSTQPRIVPRAAAPVNAPPCYLLRDPVSNRRLEQEDQAQWLELIAACEK